jgi:hypothetical protein
MTDLSPEPRAGAPTRVDPRALWTGGVAAGVVASLVAVAGIVIARGVLHIPLLAPQQHGTWGSANTPTYAACAFAATLIATGLIHLLLLFVPQPFVFFGWILGVATVVAAAEPFTSDASLSAKLATAAINLVLGGACGCSWLGPRTVHSGYSLHRPEGGRVPRIAGPLRPVEPSDVSEPMAIRPTP